MSINQNYYYRKEHNPTLKYKRWHKLQRKSSREAVSFYELDTSNKFKDKIKNKFQSPIRTNITSLGHNSCVCCETPGSNKWNTRWRRTETSKGRNKGKAVDHLSYVSKRRVNKKDALELCKKYKN
jgi:hypothetical protein